MENDVNLLMSTLFATMSRGGKGEVAYESDDSSYL